METVVQKCCVFTILLTLMATKTSAQKTSCCFAPGPVVGAGSQLTVPRPLILFSLLIFFNYVSNCLLANTNEDDDAYALMSIGSELNLVPNQTDHHYYHQPPSDFNQNSMGNIERDNGEQYNLHSENREEGTSGLSCLDIIKPSDYGWLSHQLNQPHVESTSECEEMVRECLIDLDTLMLSDSEQIHPMDGDRRSHTENNLPAEVRDLAHEKCIEHNLRPEKRGETNELDLADEVLVIDEQRHVNEKSAVNDHINNYPGEITRADLEKLFGMKRKDAAASLGVSESTFKRICRANGIAKWPRQRKGKQPATATSTQSNIGVKASYNAKIAGFPPSQRKEKQPAAATSTQRNIGVKVSYNAKIARFPPSQRKGKQLATATSTQSKIDVKESYDVKNVRFQLSLSSRKKDLEFKIEKRFGMPSGSYCIQYEDEEKDWIDITCDEDLHHGMHICKRRGIATMKMQAG